jgi:GNAT superfamily N-acetyltransferase
VTFARSTLPLPALPVATPDLVRRLTCINIAYTASRMGVIMKRSPDLGCEIKMLEGGAAAFMSRSIPSPHFNRVVGLSAGQEHLVAELDDWYRAAGAKGGFAFAPDDFSPAFGKALMALGYYPSEFDTMLYGAPQAFAPAGDSIDIVEVTSAEVIEPFLDVLLAGWSVPEQFRDGSKANMRGWLGLADWQLFLARLDGRPGAAGVLFVNDNVGYFPDAATHPTFRGNGLQSALLRHRSAVAAARGLDLIYSHAAFGSISHRNMERIGLRVLCTRMLWSRSHSPGVRS